MGLACAPSQFQRTRYERTGLFVIPANLECAGQKLDAVGDVTFVAALVPDVQAALSHGDRVIVPPGRSGCLTDPIKCPCQVRLIRVRRAFLNGQGPVQGAKGGMTVAPLAEHIPEVLKCGYEMALGSANRLLRLQGLFRG